MAEIKLFLGLGLALVVFLGHSAESAQPCGTALQETIYDQLFNIQRYSGKFRPPPGNPGYPTEVAVDLFIADYVVDHTTTTWTVDFFVRQTWVDSRLQYDYSTYDCPDHEYLQLLTLAESSQVWQPDLSFYGQLSSFNHETPDRRNHFLRIYSSGKVETSYYVSVTSPCVSDAKGDHVCQIIPTMYGSTLKDVDLIWQGGNPVEIDVDRMKMNKHVITEIEKTKTEQVATTGTYAQLVANFLIRDGATYSASSSYTSPSYASSSYNAPSYSSPSYTSNSYVSAY